MIGHLLNQVALLHVKSGVNEYNEPAFNPPLTINVRFEKSAKVMKIAPSEEVVSEARLYSEVEIKEGDKIEYNGGEWIAFRSKAQVGFDGMILYWEVYL